MDQEPSTKPEEYTNISEMRELVESHVQENRRSREAYLELLRKLDKNLDTLNTKLDNIAENGVTAARDKASNLIHNEDEAQEEIDHQIYDHEIIDLSFLPLTNADDLDDLEEKLSSEYDYKQNMVTFLEVLS